MRRRTGTAGRTDRDASRIRAEGRWSNRERSGPPGPWDLGPHLADDPGRGHDRARGVVPGRSPPRAERRRGLLPARPARVRLRLQPADAPAVRPLPPRAARLAPRQPRVAAVAAV